MGIPTEACSKYVPTAKGAPRDPKKMARIETPNVCSEMGMGVKGKGIETCAKIPKSTLPKMIEINLVIVLSDNKASCSLITCSFFIDNLRL
jgi:hypothetical protein